MFRRRAIPCLLLLAVCTACGQVGPLHLPQDAPDNEGYLLVHKKSVQKNAAAAQPAAPAPSSPQ